MMASWRQLWRNWGWRKTAPLAMALIFALILVYYGGWAPARGQESPVATPAPAAPEPTVAPSAIISTQLPSMSGVIHDASGKPLAGLIVTAYQRDRNIWIDRRETTTNGA